jgi:hypothetical protein
MKPAWIIIECIADSARLLASDLSNKLFSSEPEDCSDTLDDEFYREKPMHCSNCCQLDHSHETYFEEVINDEIKKFVCKHVSDMLNMLYRHLKSEEVEVPCNAAPGSHGNQRYDAWRECFSTLYKKQSTSGKKSNSEAYLVGPVGERPLHVCALLAARFKGELKNHGSSIADGIFDGMKSFLDDQKYADEVLVPYGRDYCAAVGRYLEKDENWSKLEDLKLPMVEDLKRWYKARCAGKKGKNWEAHQAHIKAIVSKGLYQGETLIFPFIASEHADAVKWFVDKFSTPATHNALR